MHRPNNYYYNNTPNKFIKKGTTVATLYGEGVMESSVPRAQDGICVVKLSWGGSDNTATTARLYTNPLLYPVRKIMTPEQFDAAFEAFENVRRFNLEVECHERGVSVDYERCTLCLLSEDNNKTTKPPSTSTFLFGSITGSSSTHPKKLETCLLCGSPVCMQHMAKKFAKEKIFLCVQCEELLRMKLDRHEDPVVLQHQTDQLTSLYDRGFVSLQYMCRVFVPALVEQLDVEERTDNQVALGRSSAGVLAGVMGLAGASLILTPAGIPLVYASLALGAGGSALGLGYSAKKKYWAVAPPATGIKPLDLANRIIAIYGLLQSILVTIVVFREEIQRDPQMGNVISSKDQQSAFTAASNGGGRNPYLEALSQGAAATSFANTGFQVGAATGQTTFSNVFQYMGLAPGLNAIFSALMMTVNLHTVTATLEKMHTGSKSEKVAALTCIGRTSVLILPTTDDVEADIQDTIWVMMQSGSGSGGCTNDDSKNQPINA